MSADPNTPLWARIIKRVLRWLVVLAIMSVLGWFGFLSGGKILCRIAIGQIAELTNTRIKTGSFDFHSNGEVFIEDLIIEPYRSDDRDQTILKAKRVHARFDVASLFALRPKLKRIDVNDFVFNAQYNQDTERWNLSSLKLHIPKTSSGTKPQITLGGGRLRYTKVSGQNAKVLASMPISAKFGFGQHPRQGYSFEFRTAPLAGGPEENRLTGNWEPGVVTIAGGIASADISEYDMQWTIDRMAAELKYDQNDLFTLDMRIFDVNSQRSINFGKIAEIGPDFVEKLTPFAVLRKLFDRYKPCGLADINIKASGNLRKLNQIALTGDIDCKDVEIVYSRFPYLVKHLKGKVDFTRNSATLNNLSGSHGDVKLLLNGWTRGFAPDLKYDVRITSENMKLDNDLYKALNPASQKTWSLFSPSGIAAIDYHTTRNSSQVTEKHLTADLRGVDVLYRTFPYPARNLSGKLSFENSNVIISNVVSDIDGCRIALEGKVTGRGTDSLGYDISIDVNNIPLDRRLHDALPEKQKDLYDQFSPTGTTDGNIKISKSPLPGIASTFVADLSLSRGSLTSDRLPLPVTDVTATAVFAHDQIEIKNFSGRYGETPVSIEGEIWPEQDDQPLRYSLSLEFKDTLLNDDLFELLPESAAKIVADFKPEGKINLTADMSKLYPNDEADYKFVIDCLGNSANLPPFSYPLKDITGTLTITPQAVVFQDVDALPGDEVWIKLNTAFIKLDGRVDLKDNAFGSALFEIEANDIFFDRRLAAAIPAGMLPLYNKLAPPAHFDLDLDRVSITPAKNGKKNLDIEGRARLDKCSLEISGVKVEFDADLDLEELKITLAEDGERYIDIKTLASLERCSLPISGATALLVADLNIDGRYTTNDGFENCRLLLDGQTFKILGKTFTNLKTDFDYNPQRKSWTSDSLTADCYHGKIVGKLEFKKAADETVSYALQTGFENIDLKEFLSDTKVDPNSDMDRDHTAGRMEGSLNISARIGESSSRLGACKLSIEDMQVGRLSPMAKLVQVLRLLGPTKYAFERMFLDSYIKADNLLVRKLDLAGKSAAFYGSGLVDLRTLKIDLGLIARGKRDATADPSVIGSLAEGLGQAVFKIEVIGDFYDPQIITRPLPFIKGTLGILGKPIEPK